MSILIRDMKMPKSCYVCPANYDSIECSLVHGIELRGKDGEFLYIAERHADCPLIELPPHGRLVDAGKLTYLMGMDEHFSPLEAMYLMELIADTPTIIPAEVDE